jgi:hypothetical protein
MQYSSYLPLSWDLLAYDAAFYPEFHPLISKRWSTYGHSIYEILRNGWRAGLDLSIKSLFPLVIFEGNNLSIEPKLLSLARHITSLPMLNGDLDLLDMTGLPTLSVKKCTKLLNKYKSVAEYHKPSDKLTESCIAIYTYAQENQFPEHLRKIIKEIAINSDWNIPDIIDIQYWPQYPDTGDIGNILILDRPDMMSEFQLIGPFPYDIEISSQINRYLYHIDIPSNEIDIQYEIRIEDSSDDEKDEEQP